MAENGDSIVQINEGGEDRISNLPRNVLDRILEFVSTRDVVRTSILSTQWRYVWVDHQKLVLDEQFFEEMFQNSARSGYLRLANIIHRILLQHIGPILIFGIDTSYVSREDIDLWILVLSRKGVRELTLDNSSGDDSASARYELSSHIFSFCELTHLSISSCIMKVPSNFGGFSKLNKLILRDIILGTFVLRTPLLVHLELRRCSGVRNFNVVAPILEVLHLKKNDDLELTYFMIFEKLKTVHVDHYEVQHQGEGQRIINLMELLVSWPLLSELSIDGKSLKNLCPRTIPERLPITLSHFRCLKLHNAIVNLNKIACLLCIIRSSPILHTFQILGSLFRSNDVEVLEYLNEPGCISQNIEQLHIVVLMHFKGSRAEMQFVRLLLSRSPSLGIMHVSEDMGLDPNERLRIMKELLQFPRASTTATIYAFPI